MSIQHLPEQVVEIIDQQGWDKDSVIIHLIGFIQEQGPIAWEETLVEYVEEMAQEENEQASYLEV